MKRAALAAAVWGILLFVPMVSSAQMMGRGFGHLGGSWDYVPPGAQNPMSIEEAAEAVADWLEIWDNPDLELAEVMEFDNHFYAEIEEESMGIHAFEILINRYTGDVFPEPGPNMMWNTKYGHMGGGMMGRGRPGWPWGRGRRWRPGYQADPGEQMPVSPEQARQDAQKFLERWLPDTEIADEVDVFYGYYTLHVLKDEAVYGMLGVKGYTGEVWYHEWHGDFVQMKEFEDHT